MRSCVALAILIGMAGEVLAAGAYSPAVNFELHCMGCHLADGSGQPGRIPSVRRSLRVFSQTPRGRDFVIRVPGVAQSPLSDEDTAQLLNWMAGNLNDRGGPSTFKAYSAAEVHQARNRPLTQVRVKRARLLKELGSPALQSGR